MYKGKYQRPARKRKARNQSSILIISLVLLIAVVVGGSMAYLQDTTNQVENTFTPAEVKVAIDEETTDTSKSGIQFQNTGNVPAYIRATLVVYWKDGEGNIVAPPAGSSVKVAYSEDNKVDISMAAPKNYADPKLQWSREDAIYYYPTPVAPGGSTSVMLDPIEVTIPSGSNYKCYIDVRAEAIQAEGMNATSAQEAWAKAKTNAVSGN